LNSPILVIALGVTLAGCDRTPVSPSDPSTPSETTIRVLHDDSIWSAPAGEGRLGVDVIVRISQGSRSWLLRGANQPINGSF